MQRDGGIRRGMRVTKRVQRFTENIRRSFELTLDGIHFTRLVLCTVVGQLEIVAALSLLKV